MENFATRRVGVWGGKKKEEDFFFREREREELRMTKGFIQIDCQDVLFFG